MTDSIPFTQYLRPDGRRIQITAPLPTGFGARVSAILDHGWEFEAEVLRTGQVSLTVSNGEEDIAGPFISNNDDGVMDSLKQLIVQATSRLNEEKFING